MKRINTEGAIFSVAHQAKSAPALTSQNASRLPRLCSIATGLVGAIGRRDDQNEGGNPIGMAQGQLDRRERTRGNADHDSFVDFQCGKKRRVRVRLGKQATYRRGSAYRGTRTGMAR